MYSGERSVPLGALVYSGPMSCDIPAAFHATFWIFFLFYSGPMSCDIPASFWIFFLFIQVLRVVTFRRRSEFSSFFIQVLRVVTFRRRSMEFGFPWRMGLSWTTRSPVTGGRESELITAIRRCGSAMKQREPQTTTKSSYSSLSKILIIYYSQDYKRNTNE